MRVRKLEECEELIAGDGTRLRELFHPKRAYSFGGRYSLAHACVSPGDATKPHYLKSNEVYFILAGEGEMHIGDESATVKVGDIIEIPAGQSQWIDNIGNAELVFLCIVDPAWRKEDEKMSGE